MTAANVVQLRPPGYRFDEAWDARWNKQRGEGREATQKLWRKLAAKWGDDALIEAMRAFKANDKDLQRTGGPGLSVWLNQGRFENWFLTAAETELAGSFVSFPNVAVWTAAVEALGLPFCRSYLAPYGWCEETSRLIVPRARLTAIERLKENARQLKACGVMGLKLED